MHDIEIDAIEYVYGAWEIESEGYMYECGYHDTGDPLIICMFHIFRSEDIPVLVHEGRLLCNEVPRAQTK